MLGWKTGMRSTNRGIEDIRAGALQMKAHTTQDPHEKLRLLQQQYEMHRAEARNNRKKARGLFNGPARIRMAEASDAKAEEVALQIQQAQQEIQHRATYDGRHHSTQTWRFPDTHGEGTRVLSWMRDHPENLAAAHHNGKRLPDGRVLVYVELVHEADNSYDPNAVLVCRGGAELGWLSAEVAKIYGPRARELGKSKTVLEVPMLMTSEEDAEVFLPHPGHLAPEKHQAWREQDREARGQAAAARARASRPDVGRFQNHQGTPGSLPAGWKLQLRDEKGLMKVSSNALNKPITSTGRRVTIALVLFVLVSLVLIGGGPGALIFGAVAAAIYWAKSGKNNRARTGYWAPDRPLTVTNAETKNRTTYDTNTNP